MNSGFVRMKWNRHCSWRLDLISTHQKTRKLHSLDPSMDSLDQREGSTYCAVFFLNAHDPVISIITIKSKNHGDTEIIIHIVRDRQPNAPKISRMITSSRRRNRRGKCRPCLVDRQVNELCNSNLSGITNTSIHASLIDIVAL